MATAEDELNRVDVAQPFGIPESAPMSWAAYETVFEVSAPPYTPDDAGRRILFYTDRRRRLAEVRSDVADYVNDLADAQTVDKLLRAARWATVRDRLEEQMHAEPVIEMVYQGPACEPYPYPWVRSWMFDPPRPLFSPLGWFVASA